MTTATLTDADLKQLLLHRALVVASETHDPSAPESQRYIQQILATPLDTLRAELMKAD